MLCLHLSPAVPSPPLLICLVGLSPSPRLLLTAHRGAVSQPGTLETSLKCPFSVRKKDALRGNGPSRRPQSRRSRRTIPRGRLVTTFLPNDMHCFQSPVRTLTAHGETALAQADLRITTCGTLAFPTCLLETD